MVGTEFRCCHDHVGETGNSDEADGDQRRVGERLNHRVPPRPPIPGGVTVGQVLAHLSRQSNLKNSLAPDIEIDVNHETSYADANGVSDEALVNEPNTPYDTLVGREIRHTNFGHARRAQVATMNRGHPRAHGWSASLVLDHIEEAALGADQGTKDKRHDQSRHVRFAQAHSQEDSKEAGDITVKKRGTEESKKHAKRQAGVKLPSETALGKTAPE